MGIMQESRLYLIFEFLTMDLKKYLDTIPAKEMMNPNLVKSYTYQILQAMLFCHQRRVLHRDLKPQNLLIDKSGAIKIADFGLARAFGVPVRVYTHEVVTLWYRAPEILLGCAKYSTPIDIWSLGAIVAEMIGAKPPFQGDSEIDQLFKIFRILGTPTEQTWPGVTQLQEFNMNFPIFPKGQIPNPDHFHLSKKAVDLVMKFLIYDPTKRMTTTRALQHPYFDGLDKSLFPGEQHPAVPLFDMENSKANAVRGLQLVN